ncbi:GNAT family N-acetyltransferase [Pseudomonas aeruginosa]
MLNRLRAFRERGWREVDALTYAQAWQRFGGSVATHPLVVEQLAEMAGIPVRYLGWESAGELVAAIPTWGRHLALSKDVLKRRGKKGLYDLGNAELILPVADDARIALRHAGRYLSALHERNIVTLRPQTEQLAFARAPEDFSKKFRYNQRREVRLVEEAGGQVRQADSFAPAEFAAIYLELFQRRWGFPATGAERMAEVFERLRELLRGSVLLLNDQPIAVQVLYRAEAPGWLSVEYINGGVDPQTREFSPGSCSAVAVLARIWKINDAVEMAPEDAQPIEYQRKLTRRGLGFTQARSSQTGGIASASQHPKYLQALAGRTSEYPTRRRLAQVARLSCAPNRHGTPGSSLRTYHPVLAEGH